MSEDAIEIGVAGPDDLPTLAALVMRGFLATRKPSADYLELLRKQAAEYEFRLARIGGVACGVCRGWDIQLPVPGDRAVPARAVGALSVLSSHRRRGVASAIVRSDLALAHERGAVLSILIPSQAGIYGRFGYGPATETVHLKVDSTRLRFAQTARGQIDLEATDDPGIRQLVSPLHRKVAAGLPGAFPRSELLWDRVSGLAGDIDELLHRPAVLARTPDGEVVGAASYRISGEWSLTGSAAVDLLDLTATTPAAYQALWQFVADLDLTDRIVAADRPVHEPLAMMLTDSRAVTEADRTEFQWVRLLDVPRALTGRLAQGPGRVVLEVLDPDGFGAGRWQVDADEQGRIEVARTGQEPDVTLPVQTLGAIYLGQMSLTRLQVAGRADEHRAGGVRRLDRMLAWNPSALVGHTWF